MTQKFRSKLQRVLRNQTLLGIGGLLCLTFSAFQLQSIRKHRSPQPLWVLELAQSIEVLTQSKSDSTLSEILLISQKHNLPITNYLAQGRNSEIPNNVRLTLKSQTGLSADTIRNWFDDGAVQEYVTTSAKSGCHSAKLQMMESNRVGSPDFNNAYIKAYGGSFEQVKSGTWINAWRNEPMSTFPICQKSLVLDALVNIDFVHIVMTEVERNHGFKMPQGEEVENLMNDASTSIRASMKAAFLLGLSLTLLVAISIALGKQSTLLPKTYFLSQLLPEECIAELFALRHRREKAKVSRMAIRFQFYCEILSLLLVFHLRIRVENLLLPTRNKIDD